MAKIRLLGISGSLRKESYSTAVLKSLQQEARDRATIHIFDLSPIPLYNQDLENTGLIAPVHELREAIRSSDGVVIVSPEYNYGIPGVLKNALDWASRPAYKSAMVRKPTLYITNSPGAFGGARADNQIRQTLGAMLARIVPLGSPAIPFVDKKLQDGRLTDEATIKFLLTAIDALVAEIHRDQLVLAGA